MSGIKIDSNVRARITNCTFSGLDTAISSTNSNLLLQNTTFHNNHIGLKLNNSPTTMIDSKFVDNQIDIIIDKAPINIIDSIVSTIVVDGIKQYWSSSMNVNVYIDPVRIEAAAKDVLKTPEVEQKRYKFKQLLSKIWEYSKDSFTFFGMLKTIYEQLTKYGAGFDFGSMSGGI